MHTSLKSDKNNGVVFFFWGEGNSPTSEFYMPTFRKTLSHLHWRCKKILPAHTIYEDGTDRGFRNVCASNPHAGESPKRKNTTFRTRRKCEIMKNNGTLNENLRTFMVICGWIVIRMRDVSDKSCRENQNTRFVFNNSPPPPKNRALFEIMWKNTVE